MGDAARGLVVDRIRAVLLGRTRVVMLVAGVGAAALVVGAALLDEGEVVQLSIRDDTGRKHVTDLWIVDLDGRSYLRAGDPDARWLARLRRHPEVSLSRGDEKLVVVAHPDDDPALRERVSSAMAEKYGFTDSVFSLLSDRSQSVAIRLEPVSEPARRELVGYDRNAD